MMKQWSVVSGRWIVGGRSAAEPAVRYALRPAPSRPAFTLVELLVVMTILGILASMILFALAGAQESARVNKTQATINKLNALIMAKFESYRTRRMPISIPAGTAPVVAAKYRLDALRDIMRMEMPDSFADIDDAPVTKTTLGGTTPISRPAINLAYQRALPAVGNRNNNAISAKCLYLNIIKGSDDPDVLEEFAPNEIATDAADNMHYFVDGWGNPIKFLRWAPGFTSPLQEVRQLPNHMIRSIRWVFIRRLAQAARQGMTRIFPLAINRLYIR